MGESAASISAEALDPEARGRRGTGKIMRARKGASAEQLPQCCETRASQEMQIDEISFHLRDPLSALPVANWAS